MQGTTALRLRGRHVRFDLSQDAPPPSDFTIRLGNHDSKKGLEYCRDYDVEKLGGGVWVLRHNFAPGMPVGSSEPVEIAQVDFFAGQHLDDWVLSIGRIDCYPQGRRVLHNR